MNGAVLSSAPSQKLLISTQGYPLDFGKPSCPGTRNNCGSDKLVGNEWELKGAHMVMGGAGGTTLGSCADVYWDLGD